MSFYSNRISKTLIAWMIAAAGALSAGCTSVDDALGQEFIPDDQRLQTRIVTLGADPAGPAYITGYLLQEDSLAANRQGWIALGSDYFAPLGTTTASALVQLTPQSWDTSHHVVGHLPVIDSAFLRLLVLDNTSTSTTPQPFTIYEVTDPDFMADTAIYYDYPVASHADMGTPLFSFTMRPDTTGYLAHKLEVTPAGQAWLDRLIATDITFPGVETIREKDSLFVGQFNGLYIAPSPGAGTGGIWRVGTSVLTYGQICAGLSIFLRNHDKDDPSVIADTVVAYYDVNDEPYDSYYASPAGYPQAIIHIDRQYHASLPVNDLSTPAATTWVEGMGGLYTRLQFTPDLFTRLNQLRGDKQMALSSAVIYLEVEGGHDPAVLDEAFTRLGMFQRYANLATTIPDYNPSYEAQAGTGSLPYGGYLIRAAGGYYTMDITTSLQRMLADPAYPRLISVTPDQDFLTDYTHTPLKGRNIQLKLTYTLVP